MNSPKEIHDHLSARITRAQVAYHGEDQPLISDQAYDSLVAQLRELEAQHPELKGSHGALDQVGSAPSALFAPVRHAVSMQSLDNVFDEAGLAEFDQKLKRQLGLSADHDLRYWSELKIDGLSISLDYQGGQLQRAVTRGDGQTGEDVTHNVRLISAVPQRIKYTGPVTVRGELYMSRADFTAYNAWAAQNGRDELRNARNGAAGALRRKTADPERLARISLMAYGLHGLDLKTHSDIRKWLSEQGFASDAEATLHPSAQSAGRQHLNLDARRDQLDMDADGTVIKLDDLALQREAGSNSRAPRHSVAFKFTQVAATTVLDAVTFQVGRTGRVTPVAELRPVDVDGSTVTRSTLHNEDFIALLDLHLGDTVSLQKAGGVIPEITGVDLAQRPEGAPRISYPHSCPSCGSALRRHEGEAGTFCDNEACPARLPATLEYAVSRDVLDLPGMGEQVIAALVREGLVKDAAGFFELGQGHLDALSNLELEADGKRRKLGAKTAVKLLAGIDAQRGAELWRFIRALGIPNTGKGTSTRLAKAFGSLQAVADASLEALGAVPDIGPLTAGSIHSALREGSARREMIRRFEAAGVTPQAPSHTPAAQAPLTGLTFVLTGTFSVGRGEIEHWLETRGARIGSSVNKKTSYLVQGAGGGSKAEKAATLGIPFMDEAQLREFTAGHGLDWLK